MIDDMDVRLGRGELRRSPYNSDQSVYRNWIEPYFGDENVVLPPQSCINDYWNWWLREGTSKNDTYIEQSKVLSRLYRFAQAKGYIRGSFPKFTPNLKKENTRRGAFIALSSTTPFIAWSD